MNLADALGVIVWHQVGQGSVSDQDASLMVEQVLPSQDVYCVASELEEFWQDSEDARWRLLTAVLQAFQLTLDDVMPLTGVDEFDGSGILLVFGQPCEIGVSLPDLMGMLHQPIMKQQAWYTWCDYLKSKATA